MKKAVLATLVAFSCSSFADPVKAVAVTAGQLMQVLQLDGAQRVAGLCRLVAARVDTATIGKDLLGRQYASLTRDARGIQRFQALVPSIIVNEFYNSLSGVSGSPVVDPTTLPRGGSRVGVQVSLGGTLIVLVVNKTSGRIVDLEGRNVSLVRTKATEFKRDLDRYWNENNFDSLPVSKLTDQLQGSLAVRCN